MKKNHRAFILLSAVCLLSAVYLWQSTDTDPGAAPAAGKSAASGAAPGAGQILAGNASSSAGALPAGGAADPALASPFGPAPATAVDGAPQGAAQPVAATAVAPEKEVISSAEAARRQKMEALGYMVPTDYYGKDVKTLRAMARRGDAFAMVHLGEKYYFELNGNKSNPDYDSKTDYPSAAKQSFKEALAAGNIRSAGIISELYLQENNVVEAYAWHIVSEQMGDSISADWFRGTKVAQQANDSLKQQASARAAKISAELNLLKKKAG